MHEIDNMANEITEINRVCEIERHVLELTLSGARLPSPVFRKPFRQYFFFDFARCFNPHLIRICNNISKQTETLIYYFVMINPSPRDYYYRHFGRFGLFSFAADEHAERAWDCFKLDPGHSPADALAYITNEFIILADDAKWVLQGSRQENAMVLGSQIPIDSTAITSGACIAFDLHSALNDFLKRDRYFSEQMHKNYK
jgi:hypothetical protein